MALCTVGSLNIDRVYQVPHMVRPGETLASLALDTGPGGKGLNQSIALARAGATVSHIGCIGSDGDWLVALLRENGVDTQHIRTLTEVATGHAIIQVDHGGENAIVLHAGANHGLTADQVAAALSEAQDGAVVLLQNETNAIAESITIAAERGCQVWLNPAPFTAAVHDLPLARVHGLIVNETEACDLAGCDDIERAIITLRHRYPNAILVCTQGARGVAWHDADRSFTVPAAPAQVVDTTAAGDCFIGYLLAALEQGIDPVAACQRACAAAAIAVSQPGAATSIPRAERVESAVGEPEKP